LLEHSVQTGADLTKWRRRLGWSIRSCAYWYGAGVVEWEKFEQLDYLPLTVIRRVQDFDWVRHQGYEPTRTVRVKPA
jgi:hypothetical protein